MIDHRLAGELTGHVLMAAVASLLAVPIAGLGVVGLRQQTSRAAAPAVEQRRPSETASV